MIECLVSFTQCTSVFKHVGNIFRILLRLKDHILTSKLCLIDLQPKSPGNVSRSYGRSLTMTWTETQWGMTSGGSRNCWKSPQEHFLCFVLWIFLAICLFDLFLFVCFFAWYTCFGVELDTMPSASCTVGNPNPACFLLGFFRARRLKYMDMVVRETLRLCSPVQVAQRGLTQPVQCGKYTLLPGGHSGRGNSWIVGDPDGGNNKLWLVER